MTKHAAVSLLLLAAACLTALSTGGCSVLGLVAYATSKPPKVPARYALPAVPTIVLVESSKNPGYATLDAQQIARRATTLMQENGLAFMLDPGLAVEHQSRRNADGSRLRPSELARACGAQQFVYVDLTSYGTTTALAREAADGQAEAAVWVVDANSAQVLWPPQTNQGFPIAANVPFTPISTGTTDAGIRGQINEELALKAARIFYEWTGEQ